ncbi:NmrA-like family [Seminavis robusta]|uniref:NmrA-like family n=1 Tax=Seminavis robusta TaxID=568900 RepID=A0A9N8DJP3_9STRA|nr:NmrA-like family [Seminavis robusta]|eukprot:Sro165_g073840.1 NmrA-like family (191) ;mRNA; f:40284-40856
MVRSPEKFDLQHDNLSVIQGDFSNGDAIQETVRGTTYVICTGGGPHNSRQYEKGFMERFVREQLWPAVLANAESSPPKALLFQAGALSKVSKLPNFSQLLIAPLMGLRPMALDNDAVMRFIDSNPLKGTKVIVTRPGALINGKGGSDLRASCMANTIPLTYADLGRFNVQTVSDEEFGMKYPYVCLKNGF